jgi:hypothetical protein
MHDIKVYGGNKWRSLVSSAPRSLYALAKRPKHPHCRRLGEIKSRSGTCAEEKNLLPLLRIEIRCTFCPACGLVIKPSMLCVWLLHYYNIYYIQYIFIIVIHNAHATLHCGALAYLLLLPEGNNAFHFYYCCRRRSCQQYKSVECCH